MLKNTGQTRLLFIYIRTFSQHYDKYSTKFDYKQKSIDGMLGIQNLSGRMVDPDESTELWCPPKISLLSPPPSRDVVVEQQRVLERPEHREQRAQGPRLQAHHG